MKRINRELSLIAQLVLRPVKTIRDKRLTQYSSKNMEWLFFIGADILTVVISIYPTINKAVQNSLTFYDYRLFYFIITFGTMYLGRELTILIDCLFLKVGVSTEISLRFVRKLLIPIILIENLMTAITIIISQFIPNSYDIVSSITLIWHAFMLFLIINYEFEKSVLRSAILVTVYYAIGFLLEFVIR